MNEGMLLPFFHRAIVPAGYVSKAADISNYSTLHLHANVYAASGAGDTIELEHSNVDENDSYVALDASAVNLNSATVQTGRYPNTSASPPGPLFRYVRVKVTGVAAGESPLVSLWILARIF